MQWHNGNLHIIPVVLKVSVSIVELKTAMKQKAFTPCVLTEADGKQYFPRQKRLPAKQKWSVNVIPLCHECCLVHLVSVSLVSKSMIQYKNALSRPRGLSWMRRPTGDQEVAGSTPAEVGNILSWRLIMKYFLRSFSLFRWFKKGICQFLGKECAQYWLTA